MRRLLVATKVGLLNELFCETDIITMVAESRAAARVCVRVTFLPGGWA